MANGNALHRRRLEKASFPVKLPILLLVFVLAVSTCTQRNSDTEYGNTPVVADSVITQTVYDRFQSAPEITIEGVDVTTRSGIVTLRGTVDNLLTRKEALRITRSIRGVRSVVNNLTVSISRSDQAIERDLTRALATDPATEKWEISSQVNNGVVRLKGVVDSWHERRLAETVASSIKGVVDVTNNLTINYSNIRNENEIAAEVKQLIKWDNRIDDKLINVNVVNNKVILSGSVGSAREKQLAKQHAFVSGIDEVVVKQLNVRPALRNRMVRSKQAMNLDPQKIQQAILDAWKYDPRIRDFDLKVSVENKTAILDGKVDNLKAKLAAETDARNTVGITRVENNIEVENRVIVRPDISVKDDAVAQRIRYALERDPYVDATQVKINVNNGIVQLKGTVPSNFLKNKAEDIANNTIGVLGVTNNLHVAGNGNHS